MKILNKIMLFAVVVGVNAACASLEDDEHYEKSDSDVQNEELTITNESSETYIKGRSDLSKMNELFIQDGIYDELKDKGQVSTLLVVTNDNFKQPVADSLDYIIRSHVSDIAISPANMYDGERLMMWHNKYVNISIDSIGKNGAIVDHIKFNNAYVKEVVKTSDGYIYVISDMISTPTSLYDFINSLGDEYSIFRDMVLESRQKTFDKANSKAIGVNSEGNTVYDSVFIYKNSFFDAKGFDMNSESLTATMLLFSNDVIENAMDEAKRKLEQWGLERNIDTLYRWVLKTAFFNKKYTASEIQATDTVDLSSIYSTQWRTNEQKVDADNPTELSNAIVYNVTKLRIPNNVLIYRLKDNFYYYENCTDEQKTKYFITENLTYNKCSTDVTAWTPWSGVWPEHENRVLIYNKSEGVADGQGWQLDFTPIALNDGTVTPYTIPPGRYRLAMGFCQNAGIDIVVNVLVNGKVIATSPTITLGSSTVYHYDRGTALSDRYPEGYDPTYVQEMGGNKKASNYDTDGGPIIDEVTIPDLNGDGTASQITIRITCENWAGNTSVKLNHWCLRPTVNNY